MQTIEVLKYILRFKTTRDTLESNRRKPFQSRIDVKRWRKMAVIDVDLIAKFPVFGVINRLKMTIQPLIRHLTDLCDYFLFIVVNVITSDEVYHRIHFWFEKCDRQCIQKRENFSGKMRIAHELEAIKI